MFTRAKSRTLMLGMLVLLLTVLGFRAAVRSNSGVIASARSAVLARGGGTTLVQGGTGETGGFVPVLTTLSFHAERGGQGVTGAFECLARAPEAPNGAGSAQFTVNAMYVTGQVTGAVVNGDSATLTGTANVTGLGAGSNVP